MTRSQRDEPTEPAIADGTDTASNVTAIAHIIDALEEAGIIVKT